MWNELILRHILSPINNLLRIDHKPEKVSKGLIARVCVEFDIIKPVKKRLKYFHEDVVYENLLDCENITNICFGCDSQSHKFDSCALNSKVLLLGSMNLQETSQMDESLGYNVEGKTESQDAD